MNATDEIVSWMSTAILRSGDFGLEADTLSAITEDAGNHSLDSALDEAGVFEKRAGAFGAEIIGAILVPVLVTAVRQFWESYQKESFEQLGSDAAKTTVALVKRYFASLKNDEAQLASDKLSVAIKQAAKDHGLEEDVTNKLIAAISHDKMTTFLD